METLTRSILEAWKQLHPDFPTIFYLDPEEKRVVGYIRVGASLPRAAVEGRWRRIFVAPPGALPDSVIKNLIEMERVMEHDLEHGWDKGAPAYDEGRQFEFQFRWHPADWFQHDDLKRKWEDGLTPEQVLAEDNLENDTGFVDHDEALQWLREQYNDWIATAN